MPTFLPRKFVLKVVLSVGNWKPHIADSHPWLSTLNICNSNLLFLASKRNVMFTSLSFYTSMRSKFSHHHFILCSAEIKNISDSHHLSRNQVNITCTDPSLKPSFLKTASMQETSVLHQSSLILVPKLVRKCESPPGLCKTSHSNLGEKWQTLGLQERKNNILKWLGQCFNTVETYLSNCIMSSSKGCTPILKTMRCYWTCHN